MKAAECYQAQVHEPVDVNASACVRGVVCHVVVLEQHLRYIPSTAREAAYCCPIGRPGRKATSHRIALAIEAGIQLLRSRQQNPSKGTFFGFTICASRVQQRHPADGAHNGPAAGLGLASVKGTKQDPKLIGVLPSVGNIDRCAISVPGQASEIARLEGDASIFARSGRRHSRGNGRACEGNRKTQGDENGKKHVFLVHFSDGRIARSVTRMTVHLRTRCLFCHLNRSDDILLPHDATIGI
jgi:hypothetical protein